jgi:hypothetical protein
VVIKVCLSTLKLKALLVGTMPQPHLPINELPNAQSIAALDKKVLLYPPWEADITSFAITA